MQKFYALLIASILFIAGCSSAPKEPPIVETIEEPQEVPAIEPVADEEPLFDDEPVVLDPDCLEPCIYTIDAIDDPSSELAKRLIFFDYDQSTIREEFKYTIEQHAAYLKSHPSAQIRLEGHTDERGSREYNVALGEQRSLSVRQLLLFQGVDASQITTVSFGEELPLDLGRNEDAWAQNRRVEIVYN